MKQQFRRRLRTELGATITKQRDEDDSTVFDALRAKLDELDPKKAKAEPRKKRGTRDRQQTAGHDRGTA